MKINFFQVIITALATWGASWVTYRGTKSTAKASTQSAWAESYPEIVDKVQELIDQLQSKNEKIADLTTQVQSQSATIDALTKQVGELQSKIDKLTAEENHEKI